MSANGSESSFSMVSPVGLSMYLRSLGWKEDRASRTEKVSFWIIEDGRGEEKEVLIPQQKGLRDYETLVRSCINTIFETKHRPVSQIVNDILTFSYDVIRLPTPTDEIGLPVDQSLGCIDGVRGVIESSACSIFSPSFYFPSRKSREVTDIMKKVRLGHTEKSSYVIKFLIPIEADLSNPDFQLETPVERRVTEQVSRSISALYTSAADAVSSGSLKPIADAVPDGVSGNLCESISEIFSYTTSDSLNLTIEWAKTRTEPNIVSSFSLSRDYEDVIKTAAKAFRSSHQETELVGLIIKMERDPDGGRPKDEKVKLYTMIDQKPRHVEINLREEDHDKAAQAYHDGLPVRCNGILAKRGNIYKFEKYYQFEIASFAD